MTLLIGALTLGIILSLFFLHLAGEQADLAQRKQSQEWPTGK